MKRKRFSEEQIVGILKEHEAGITVSELCRKHGVRDASIILCMASTLANIKSRGMARRSSPLAEW